MQEIIDIAIFIGKCAFIAALFWAGGFVVGFVFSFFVSTNCKKEPTLKGKVECAAEYGIITGKAVMILTFIALLLNAFGYKPKDTSGM